MFVLENVYFFNYFLASNLNLNFSAYKRCSKFVCRKKWWHEIISFNNNRLSAYCLWHAFALPPWRIKLKVKVNWARCATCFFRPNTLQTSFRAWFTWYWLPNLKAVSICVDLGKLFKSALVSTASILLQDLAFITPFCVLDTNPSTVWQEARLANFALQRTIYLLPTALLAIWIDICTFFTSWVQILLSEAEVADLTAKAVKLSAVATSFKVCTAA